MHCVLLATLPICDVTGGDDSLPVRHFQTVSFPKQKSAYLFVPPTQNLIPLMRRWQRADLEEL